MNPASLGDRQTFWILFNQWKIQLCTIVAPCMPTYYVKCLQKIMASIDISSPFANSSGSLCFVMRLAKLHWCFHWEGLLTERSVFLLQMTGMVAQFLCTFTNIFFHFISDSCFLNNKVPPLDICQLRVSSCSGNSHKISFLTNSSSRAQWYKHIFVCPLKPYLDIISSHFFLLTDQEAENVFSAS